SLHVGKGFEGGLGFGVLGWERECAVRRGLADRGLLYPDGLGQRCFALGMLVAPIGPESDNHQDHSYPYGAVLDEFLLVMFKEGHCVPDFKGDFVGFKFFAGYSCHENLGWMEGLL